MAPDTSRTAQAGPPSPPGETNNEHGYPPWPAETTSAAFGHIRSRLRMTRRCDHVGRMMTLRPFAPQVIESARKMLPRQPAAELIWVAESALQRWAQDDDRTWATTANDEEIALAVGLGSAVAPDWTTSSLREGLCYRLAPRLHAEFEAAAMRLDTALAHQPPAIGEIFACERSLRTFRACDSWQFLVDILPVACDNKDTARIRDAVLRLPAVITSARAGEPKMRLHNVRALAFFRLGDVAAAELELTAAEAHLSMVRSQLIRGRLRALLHSNRARLLADTPRAAEAYMYATQAVSEIPLEGSGFSAFWLHAQRGCAIAARCGRFDEFWELISSRVPDVEPVNFGDDPFHTYKSYQAFLSATAAELGRLGRTTEMERLYARRLQFLRTYLPGWTFI